MVFSSAVFLFFFLPASLLGYFLAPRRWRNAWLLLSSLFFYSWGETWFVLVMALSIVIDYCAALLIAGALPWRTGEKIVALPEGTARSGVQRLGLALSVMANLSILAFFKYFNFGVDSFNAGMAALGLSGMQWHTSLRVLLPLGISFFTFQSMSYTFDVYLGRVAATRNLLHFATFVSLFPQLVAGPIVRYRKIAAELVERRENIRDFAAGVRRFVIGLGKKLIVANAFAVPADEIFAIPAAEVTTPLAWLGVFSYTVQIYFDFSGYSDMAIGLGRMLGFTFPENFNYPYISRSITEFWRRWHISLSTWFRDYVYIPAGGNRRGAARTYFNLCLVFFLCGLWHGASWTYVIWGLYHGALLVAERLGRRLGYVAWRPLRHGYVLLTVMVGWVLFRAEDLGTSWVFLKAMAGFPEGIGGAFYPALYLGPKLQILSVIAIVGSCPVADWVKRLERRLAESGDLRRRAARALYELGATALLLGLLVLSTSEIAAGTHNPFIYFRF